MAVGPPEWPFRCPHEGWYLSHMEAVYGDTMKTPVLVTGVCRKHGRVTVKDPYCYSPHLWNSLGDE